MARASFPLVGMTAFHASMPERYRSAFEAADAREHAAIVRRRGDATVHLEQWRRLPHGGALVCLVADDRPGLLSLISAALVAQEMDIVGAQVYTRPAEGGRPAEAIDFLSLRRDAPLPLPVLRADLDRVGETLASLITGQASLEEVLRRAPRPHPARPGTSTRVTFDDAPDEGLVVLTVQTSDRPGLLLAISQALFRARVQILESDAATREGRVVDRFTIAELDGSPIASARRGLVQVEVLSAIEALARGQRFRDAT